MSIKRFEDLPDHGRVWVFIIDPPLDDRQLESFTRAFEPFVESWAAHGADLTAAFTILQKRFLVIGVDTDQTLPSGCSIDALTGAMRRLEELLEIRILDSPDCCWLEGSEVRCVDRTEFREIAERGEVDLSTKVFDRTVASVGEIRQGELLKPASSSWHARAFPLGQGTAAG